MNKTVTINISGIIFHIDENAYEVLSAYLAGIKAYLGADPGNSEVMADIEARIAELLQQRLGTAKQVVTLADVEYVQSLMGKPEDFGDEEQERGPAAEPQEKIRRRLFRNGDDKVIGGVCGGLSAYFDIDTVWVRLIMFVLVFFGGLSIWVYIILWIVIPEAKTTAEKFAMRGEHANINNIYRSFKDEAREVKDRLNKYGSDLNRNYGERVRSNVSDALYTAFNIVGRLVGLFLLIVGTALLVGYVASLTGIGIVGDSHIFNNWKQALFSSPGDYRLALAAFVLVAGVPVFMLLYVGVKLLFKIRYSNRWLTLGMGMLWLLGVVLGAYVTIDTIIEFSESARVRETAVIAGAGDTIVVKMRPAPEVLREWNFDNGAELEEMHDHDQFLFGQKGSNMSIIGYADLDVIESLNDSVELAINYLAQGSDKRVASENARNISYSYSRENNVIVFDEVFRVIEDSRWRGQRVQLKLKIPEGKVIFFDESVKTLLDDVDNTTNTWDGDMVNRRWIMTNRGLHCIDCNDLKDVSSRRRTKGKNRVIINKDGIKVDDEDARIRINNRGISIHTPGKDYGVEEE